MPQVRLHPAGLRIVPAHRALLPPLSVFSLSRLLLPPSPSGLSQPLPAHVFLSAYSNISVKNSSFLKSVFFYFEVDMKWTEGVNHIYVFCCWNMKLGVLDIKGAVVICLEYLNQCVIENWQPLSSIHKQEILMTYIQIQIWIPFWKHIKRI